MRLNLGCGAHVHPQWTNVDIVARAPGVMAHDIRQGLPFADASAGCVYASHVLEHFPKSRAPDFLAGCFRVLRPAGVARLVVPDLEALVRWYLRLLEGAVAGDPQAGERYDWIMLELFDQMVRTRSGGEMLSHWSRTPMPAGDFVLERAGGEARRSLEAFRAGKVPPECYQRDGHGPADPAEYARFRDSGELHLWMYDRFSLGRLLAEAGFTQVRVCRADESAIPGFVGYFLDTEPDGSVRKPDSLYMEGIKPGGQGRVCAP